MAEKEQVLPRNDPRNYDNTEQVAGQLDMANLIQQKRADTGLLPPMDAIDRSYEDSPGFSFVNGKKGPLGQGVAVPKEEPRSVEEAMERGQIYQPMNCAAPPVGCGQQGTVQPLSQEMVSWQCSNCGKNYVNTNA